MRVGAGAFSRLGEYPYSRPGKLFGMDKVRFGRALGYGARHAAKALTEAAKAASTPSTSQPSAASGSTSTARMPTLQEAASRVTEANQAVHQAKARVRGSAVTAGRSALAPVRRAGSVLWLELTGTVFAVFALFFAEGLWKLRDGFHQPFSSNEAHKFYLYLVVLLAFVYFAVSSFIRARRREKRP